MLSGRSLTAVVFHSVRDKAWPAHQQASPASYSKLVNTRLFGSAGDDKHLPRRQRQEREELRREPVLTLWLLCLSAPNVQKFGAKKVILKGPGPAAKSRMDGDRREREEGVKDSLFQSRRSDSGLTFSLFLHLCEKQEKKMKGSRESFFSSMK